LARKITPRNRALDPQKVQARFDRQQRYRKLSPDKKDRYNKLSKKGQDRYMNLAPRMEARERKAYLNRFAADMGLNPVRGARGSGSRKLGLAGQALSAGTSRGGSAQPSAVPTMGSPVRVNETSNPSISSIADSLEQLLAVVNKIAITESKRQKTSLDNMVSTNRTTLENQRESMNDSRGNTVVANTAQTDLTSIDKPIQELIKKFEMLSDAIDDKTTKAKDDDEEDNTTFMERFMDDMGMGDLYEANKRNQEKARRDFARDLTDDQLLDADGKKLKGDAKAKRITELHNEHRKTSSRTGKVTAKARAASGKVGDVIKSGFNSVKSVIGGGGNVRSSVKKAAMPLIKKALGKTAVKSIPFVGAAAGVGFAVSKLLEGDVVGAGIEAASGLAGPLTAVPLMIASVARDIYSDVYGVQPEQDPELMKRMPVVKDAVGEVVKEQLEGSVEPKQKPSATDVDKATVPAKPPTPPTPQATQTNAPPIAPSNPPELPTAAGGQSKPAAFGTSEYFTGKPSDGASDTAGAGVSPSSGLGSPAIQTPEMPSESEVSAALSMQESGMTAAQSLSPQTATGTDIMTATEQSDAPSSPYSNMMGYDPVQNMFRPQRNPTSSGGRVGIGNVPSPDYVPSGKNNLSDMFQLMFFNLNYQEQ